MAAVRACAQPASLAGMPQRALWAAWSALVAPGQAPLRVTATPARQAPTAPPARRSATTAALAPPLAPAPRCAPTALLENGRWRAACVRRARQAPTPLSPPRSALTVLRAPTRQATSPTRVSPAAPCLPAWPVTLPPASLRCGRRVPPTAPMRCMASAGSAMAMPSPSTTATLTAPVMTMATSPTPPVMHTTPARCATPPTLPACGLGCLACPVTTATTAHTLTHAVVRCAPEHRMGAAASTLRTLEKPVRTAR